MKLLVAEDDPFFRRILQQLLGSEFEVSTAVDGNEAWKMLKLEDGPRLAILDWVMPGMTGPEICRLVRTTPRVASAYLIFADRQEQRRGYHCRTTCRRRRLSD